MVDCFFLACAECSDVWPIALHAVVVDRRTICSTCGLLTDLPFDLFYIEMFRFQSIDDAYEPAGIILFVSACRYSALVADLTGVNVMKD